MEKRQQLVILLPECMEDMPVKIVRKVGQKELIFNVQSLDGTPDPECTEREYAFIWRHEDFLKVPLDDIERIEAAGSYSTIHLTDKRKLTVCFNISHIMQGLPAAKFVRVHRSHIVNLFHVESMIGNSLRIGSESIPIGREYGKKLYKRIIFLGARAKK